MIGVITVLLATTVAAQSFQTRDSIERPFIAGGKIHLKLSSGEYTIRAGSSDRIVVRWVSDNVRDLERKIRISATNETATIHTDGPLKDSHFIIEIPRISDIYLRVRAGEIKIQDIEGNKDIRMTAGDLQIDVNPASYSKVNASITFGDIDARALRISKSGIGRSFDWRGSGMYQLRASLFAGELTMR
jgi:hypothetical protein